MRGLDRRRSATLLQLRWPAIRRKCPFALLRSLTVHIVLRLVLLPALAERR